MDIGPILLARGLISPHQLELAAQHGHGQRLDRVLIQQGMVAEDQVLQAWGDELGMRYVELDEAPFDPEILSLFPTREVFQHALLPLQRRNGSIVVATSDPFALEAISELSSISGCRLEPVLARRDDILRLIKERLGVGGDTINELVSRRSERDIELLDEVDETEGELAEMAQAASVVRLVNELLHEALTQQASDVHLEPHERGLTVRYRVDGILRVQPVPSEINEFQSAIISRLKIMARLNIAEKRLPQDGRIKLRISGREIDVRMSIIPMLHGEGVVLRLLDKGRMVFNLKNVGLPQKLDATFRDMISLPHGIVLVTGPTGSGKTSTLYSALSEIKSPATKIITVEDPVEYHTEGISQIQVHSKIGLTFAAGLRSILRHDPDVILIGEIRDSETANSAIQASLTGHLVFSTLHTNDSCGAFTRLVDMGVEPYLVASTVEGVLAQRLIRVLCVHCKQEYRPEPGELPSDFPQQDVERIWKPHGCRQCRDTGYSGRRGIFELLRTDDTVRQLCVSRASSADISAHMLGQGMTTLRLDGYDKVLQGITGIDEVLRITKGDFR